MDYGHTAQRARARMFDARETCLSMMQLSFPLLVNPSLIPILLLDPHGLFASDSESATANEVILQSSELGSEAPLGYVNVLDLPCSGSYRLGFKACSALAWAEDVQVSGLGLGTL